VEVGAAEAGAIHPDEDIIEAGPGFRDVPEPEARSGFTFDESFHRADAAFNMTDIMSGILELAILYARQKSCI
jgi:hypothetical protein